KRVPPRHERLQIQDCGSVPVQNYGLFDASLVLRFNRGYGNLLFGLLALHQGSCDLVTRKVFFSFHYERDAWRASQVRNSWVTKPDREVAGFVDAASWEEVRKKGEEQIENWINRQLEGTSVTAVLIGRETSQRKYVGYEVT